MVYTDLDGNAIEAKHFANGTAPYAEFRRVDGGLINIRGKMHKVYCPVMSLNTFMNITEKGISTCHNFN